MFHSKQSDTPRKGNQEWHTVHKHHINSKIHGNKAMIVTSNGDYIFYLYPVQFVSHCLDFHTWKIRSKHVTSVSNTNRSDREIFEGSFAYHINKIGLIRSSHPRLSFSSWDRLLHLPSCQASHVLTYCLEHHHRVAVCGISHIQIQETLTYSHAMLKYKIGTESAKRPIRHMNKPISSCIINDTITFRFKLREG